LVFWEADQTRAEFETSLTPEQRELMTVPCPAHPTRRRLWVIHFVRPGMVYGRR
jgi:hypothetical protein